MERNGKTRASLSYCTKELIFNAQKANAKRIYFQNKGLSITDADDYRKGMRQFLHYLTKTAGKEDQQLDEGDFDIILTIHAYGGMFNIEVRNKGEMTDEESSRIYDRIIKARGFSSFYEALNSVGDVTEGAGLGIVILIQFLKRIGLGEEAFSIESEEGSTTASLQIPIARVQLDKMHALAEVVARDIDSPDQRSKYTTHHDRQKDQRRSHPYRRSAPVGELSLLHAPPPGGRYPGSCQAHRNQRSAKPSVFIRHPKNPRPDVQKYARTLGSFVSNSPVRFSFGP
jgi:hypothetical protein